MDIPSSADRVCIWRTTTFLLPQGHVSKVEGSEENEGGALVLSSPPPNALTTKDFCPDPSCRSATFLSCALKLKRIHDSLSLSILKVMSEHSKNKTELSNQFERTLPAGWAYFFEKWLDELDHVVEVLLPRKESILPPLEAILRPFRETSLDDLKVVIMGQDPYPHPFAADGLAFSITRRYFEERGIPPSLKNILDEAGPSSLAAAKEGDLSCWAKQGVLLLNAALTLEANGGMRHDFLWRGFVKGCIRECSKRGKVVFMLWGKEAQKFRKEIDESRNLVLVAPHPSPRASRHQASPQPSKSETFRGCGHFVTANEYLALQNLKIIW